MSWLSDIFSDRETEYGFTPEPKFIAKPEYAEATAARTGAGDKLTEWGNDPNYGAIAPNWDDIWTQAQDRIKQSYWGGAGGQTGTIDKVKSSAAARGVSESPALETQISRMGMQEGADIKDAAVTQATTEAAFGEQARQDWFSNMMKMAGLEMPGTWQSAVDMTPTASPVWAALGDVGAQLMAAFTGASAPAGGNNVSLGSVSGGTPSGFDPYSAGGGF